jgi:L-iditol 2-dehydrogenase
MRLALFTALRRIELADAPEPPMQRPDDVLLAIDRVGVCGSDVHYYLDGRIGDQVLHYPATLGHECSGTVLAAGPAAGHLTPGDCVAVDPAFPCRACDQCRSGRFHTCRRLLFMGSPGQAAGALAERGVVPAACCFKIPESVSLDAAMLVEPLSVGLHAVRLAEIAPGIKIAILGAGPIGLSVLLCAKATAACTVVAADLLDERLAIARRCGADATINARQIDIAVECVRLGLPEFDAVFECSGDPACIGQGQSLLKPGGALMLVGIPPGDAVSFNPHLMRRSELRFQAVRRQNQCIEPVVELIATGRLDPSSLVTHRFPLDQVSAAFELVAGYRDGVIKAVIDVGRRNAD